MMQNFPYPLRNRPELNLRHAIKSSIPEIRQLIALTIALYLSEQKSEVVYGRKDKTNILIQNEVLDKLSGYFSEQTEEFDEEFEEILNENPLFTAQIEPLQVALEIFLKLCKVKFTDGGAGSRERTGRDRYPKVLQFTTNAEIIRLAFQNNENDLKWILFDWITSAEVQEESPTSLQLKKLLTIFSEETQFRLRDDDDHEVFFQQEGIYQTLLEGHTVTAQDAHENVGPFRILKSFVSASLHPFLQGEKQSIISHKQFITNEKVDAEQLRKYAGLVGNYLDVIPKRTTVTLVEEDFDIPITDLHPSPLPDLPKNRILFGPPGSGKSHRIDKEYAKNHAQIRVTFHPDTDYHSFVGGYKPVSDADGSIRYNFVPQSFTNAYLSAWSQPERAIFLIIEEINRGNCAQIFGDLFQCLDRMDTGYSVYPVDADTDLAGFLKDEFKKSSVAAEQFARRSRMYKNIGEADYHKLILPPNLYLYATMNTSDQSLFPMDSAFKRRWDWEYVPIDYRDADKFTIDFDRSTQYSWGDFIRTVNARIYELNKSDDKQLGNRFVNPGDGKISLAVFKAKVMFYLWSEIYKNEIDSSDNIFITQPDPNKSDTKPFTFSELFEKNDDGTDTERVMTLLIGFMRQLGLEPISRSDE